ncbi:hypothetical protein [Paraburkholderia sp. MM5477-R1]|uniref:hypothetical protein n=1 Tax=Paraburkholderia sp. MM5477-R1 TaxID=2991062 RepID=UPI003D1F5EB9
MTVKVREAQYGIGLRDEPNAKLQTKNIQTCIGFAGINAAKGVAFLCHLNSPRCGWELLPMIVADLNNRGLQLNEFKLYTSIGVSPWFAISCTVPVVAGIGLSVLPIAPWVVITGAVVTSTLYWNLKVLGLWAGLWRVKAFKVKRKFLGFKFHIPGSRRVFVRVDAEPEVEQQPEADWYVHNAEDDEYTPPSGSRKANGSA